MAKSKYKIGSMIQAQREGEESETGVVKSILTTEHGYHYSFDEDGTNTFAEEQIMQAFRPIVARQPREKKAKKTRPSSNAKARARADSGDELSQ